MAGTDSRFCSADTLSCYPLDDRVPKGDKSNVGIKHTVNRTLRASLAGEQLDLLRTYRNFSLTGSYGVTFDAFTAIHGVSNAVGEGNPNGIIYCGGNAERKWSASVSEDCSISSIKVHYANMQHGVIFFEEITDSLKFTTTSQGLASFRTRWGTFYTHEFWLPANTRGIRRKRFIYSKNGSRRVLSDTSTTIDVLPQTMGAISSGGLGATDIPQNELDAAKNVDVSQIGLILCVPQPPGESMATGLDPEILAKGFYDYTQVGNESLAMLDGGKDFFYPEWIRSMTPDPYWAAEAQARYDFSFQKFPFPGVSTAVPEVQWELAPQCSYAVHPTEGEMWSWVFMDGNGKGQAFSELNGISVDPLLATAIAPHTVDSFTAYAPISLI